MLGNAYRANEVVLNEVVLNLAVKHFFVNFSHSANHNIMFGEKALELIKQLKRARDGTLPPFDVRNLCYNVC